MRTEIHPTSPNLFLEPLDLQWGPAALRMMQWHNGLPLLGGAAAAATVAVWRPGQSEPRLEIPASGLTAWLEVLPEAERAYAAGIIGAWRRPRRFPGISGTGPALMGVVNVTTDSFYPGSRRPTAAAALAEAAKAAAEGAGILDIGGQSTRPRSGPVSLAREFEAVLPVIEQAKALGVPISVDTLRPEVAQAAVSAGACIVNDISGLLPEQYVSGAALIIGDMRGNPETMQRWPRSSHGVFDIYRRLEARVASCRAGGMALDQIAIDPGFGFGKSVAHNQALIHHLPLFLGLGVTLAVGVSRKGSLGYLSGTRQPEDRLPASLAAAITAVNGGASILRVHDVSATRQMLQIARSFG